MDMPVNSTIAGLLHDATVSLAGIDTASLDAELLLMHVTGKPRTWLYAHPGAPVDGETIQRFLSLIADRRQQVPVAYLTGRREFWSLSLTVNGDTLIPRPETELLVEQALRLIPEGADWQIADLGTGSGAVALAIARERPGCRVLATDISAAALAMAAQNARQLTIDNVTFVEADWLDNVDQAFNIIISNPPYVCTTDPLLVASGIRFEPVHALAGGADGLDCIRRIVPAATRSLTAAGWLLLEHGTEQGAAVRDQLTTAGFAAIETARDLAGHERVTAGRRQP